MILSVSSMPVIMSPFLLLILCLWILSLSLLVSVAKGFSWWFFSKKQLLVSLIFLYFFFFPNWLISALMLTISCLLLLFGVFASPPFLFPHHAFTCTFKLLVWKLSNFFMEALSAMNLPIGTALIMSHKFGNAVPSFSLNSRKSLIN